MKHELEQILASNNPQGFSLSYDDMHGLWGGMTITLTGDGSYQRTQREPGGQPQTVEGKVEVEQVIEMVRLLLEIEAWQQHIPEAMLVPDESRAYLTIHCGASTSTIWERHNDLAKGQWLIQARDQLLCLGEWT